MTEDILFPMIAQGAIGFASLFILAKRRLKAYAGGETKGSYFIGFTGEGEPHDVRVAQRSFHNQFEMPVLFFVVCLATAVFGKETTEMVYLAWAYFGARLIHWFIHSTNNNVLWRFRVFIVSNFILFAMWILLAV